MGRKNDAMLSDVNITGLYVIDDLVKNKLSAEWRHASSCSNLSTNKSPYLTIGYYSRSVL